MKRCVLCILLVLVLMTIGFTQDKTKNKDEAVKSSISGSDKQILKDIIEKLKSDENDEDKVLNEVIELYKRIGNLLINELNELRKTDEEIVNKILAKITSYQLTECIKLLNVFDLIKTPDIKDKKFVAFNTGRCNVNEFSFADEDVDGFYFFYAFGWFVSEDDNSICIIGTNLKENNYRKNRKLPSCWDKVKKDHPENLPLPGFYKEYDFTKFCQSYMNDKNYKRLTPRAEDFKPYIKPELHISPTVDGFSHMVNSCLYAHWALKLGLIDLSYQLIQLAYDEQREVYKYKDTTVSKVLTNSLAAYIRYDAINEAHEGAPRSEFIRKWELLTKLPTHTYSDESAKMVKMLKKMIEEDKNWKEPTDEEFKKMTQTEQTEYWMFKLRDCKEVHFPRRKKANKKKNPANELKLLDIHAIPILIEHMDDERPTRSYCYGRMRTMGSYKPRSYGSICIQIFEEISGIKLYEPRTYGNHENKVNEKVDPKSKAQAWWEEYQ